MKNITKCERIFMAIASLWLFVNIVIYFMSKPVGKLFEITDHAKLANSIFYPFGMYYIEGGLLYSVNKYKITEVYDFTEFLVYGISPFVLFAIYKAFLKKGK